MIFQKLRLVHLQRMRAPRYELHGSAVAVRTRLQVQGRRLRGTLAGQPASVSAGAAACIRQVVEELGLNWEAAVAEAEVGGQWGARGGGRQEHLR